MLTPSPNSSHGLLCLYAAYTLPTTALKDMKLLHTGTLKLTEHEFPSTHLPPFAIVSSSSSSSSGRSPSESCQQDQPPPPKLDAARDEANALGVSYLWEEQQCLDTTSLRDTTEFAENYNVWLRQCKLCVVLLDDLLPSVDTCSAAQTWGQCAYFKRAWTIQELIWAPRIEFFGPRGRHVGSKSDPDVLRLLSIVSNIDQSILRDPSLVGKVPIAIRMTWVDGRSGRSDEDAVYALAAMTEVQLPARYGEGRDKGFARLQHEILKTTTDLTILASCNPDNQKLMAETPSDFKEFAKILKSAEAGHTWVSEGTIRSEGQGFEIRAPMVAIGSQLLVQLGRLKRGEQPDLRVAISMQRRQDTYIRVDPGSLVEHTEAGTIYRLHLDDGHPIAQIAGSKRDRSGCVKSAQHTPSSRSSSTEAVDTESQISGSDEQDHSASSEELLAGFQRVLPSLVRVAYDDIRHLSLSPLQPVSDNDRQPPRKRARREGQKSPLIPTKSILRRTSLLDDTRRYFACPYYAVSPKRHQSCLLKHGLASINDIKRHMCRDHLQRPYCPRCRLTFGNTSERDRHIQIGTCELQPPTRIEGLSACDVESLAHVDDACLSDEARWKRLLDIAAPGEDVCRSPYLSEGFELALSRLRSFWAQNGHQRVLKCLRDRGLLDPERPGEMCAVAGLEARALEGLIHRLHRDIVG